MSDVRVREALAPLGDLADVDGALRAELDAAEAADAVGAEAGLAADASAEMGLISLGGENLLNFLKLRQVLSTYEGDLMDPRLWPHERPVPMGVARGPLGIPLPSMPWPKTLCGVGAGT